MEAQHILPITCLLVYCFMFAQSCPFTVENGEKLDLVGTYLTNEDRFSWIVVINDIRQTVSTCGYFSCNDQYPGFDADVSRRIISGLYKYNLTTNLSINKVNISMSYVALEDTTTGCDIQVYVPPTKPVCDDPVFVNSHISVTCRTERVYPKAVCIFNHTGPGGALTGSVSYNHSRRHSDSLYTSECSYLVDLEKLQDGEVYEFYVEVYPDVEDGSNFNRTSEKTNSIVYERAAITHFMANDQETQSIIIEKMSSVAFDCEATSHPEATMKLLKGENRAIVITSKDFNRFLYGTNKLLYTTSLDCEASDTYTCEADNGVSDERSIKLYVKCPLRLKHESDTNEYTISGNEGTKTMTFRVTGYPEPRNYTLQIKDEASMTAIPHYEYRTNSHYEPATQISVQEITLTLLNDNVIRDAQYVLIVDNGLGELHIPFKLTMEESSDDFPVLAVALGVAGGVLLIIVIAVVAFVCHRRRTRTAQREAKAGVDNPGHNAPTTERVHYINQQPPYQQGMNQQTPYQQDVNQQPPYQQGMNQQPPYQTAGNVYFSGFPQTHHH